MIVLWRIVAGEIEEIEKLKTLSSTFKAAAGSKRLLIFIRVDYIVDLGIIE